jgi:hypothetical protein
VKITASGGVINFKNKKLFCDLVKALFFRFVTNCNLTRELKMEFKALFFFVVIVAIAYIVFKSIDKKIGL